MPPRTSSQWDHKSDKDLLLTIIDTGALKGIDWKAIAERMVAKGYTFTHEACRQHFQKIRKEARSDSPATTPTHARTTSTPKSQKRSKGLIYDGNQANSDDEEILTTPAKRAKVRAEAKVKAEGQENCQTVAYFKIEESMGSNVVDLERDDLYDDDSYA